MKKSKLLVLLPFFALLAACGGGGGDEPGPGPTPGPTDHHFSTAWSNDANQHWHSCTDAGCEEKSAIGDHTFEWVVTKETSFEAKGTESYKCTTCNYVKETRDIPQLEHSYSDDWSNDSEHHWHECLDEGYEGKDFGGDLEEHDIDGTPETDADYGVAGHTAGGSCTVCGAELESYEIPALNETDYKKKASVVNNILTETWTLKDPSSIGKEEYVITKEHKFGWVTVFDYSSGSAVKTNYNYYDFNNAFGDLGLELSVDTSKKIATLTVDSEGVTLDDLCFTFNSGKQNKTSFVITGGDLTMNAPANQANDTISFYGDTSTSYMMTGIIDNNTTIIANDNPGSKSGLYESYLTVNAGASLTIKGFVDGITAGYTPITVKGSLDIDVTNLAVVPSSAGKNRTIKADAGLSFYFNDELQSEMTSTDTNTLADQGVSHLEIKAAE